MCCCYLAIFLHGWELKVWLCWTVLGLRAFRFHVSNLHGDCFVEDQKLFERTRDGRQIKSFKDACACTCFLVVYLCLCKHNNCHKTFRRWCWERVLCALGYLRNCRFCFLHLPLLCAVALRIKRTEERVLRLQVRNDRNNDIARGQHHEIGTKHESIFHWSWR